MPSGNTERCYWRRETKVTQKNFVVEQNVFERIYDNLNRTLSGNLATVFRSEWKAKNSFESGIAYLKKVIKKYHGTRLLSPDKIGVDQIEHVRRALSLVSNPEALKIRDMPGPEGAVRSHFYVLHEKVYSAVMGENIRFD